MELISPIPVSPKIHYGYRAICGKPDSPKLQRPGPPRFPVGTPRIAPQFHRGEEGLFLLARRPRGGQFLRTSNVNWGFHGNRRIGFIGRFLASPKRGGGATTPISPLRALWSIVVLAITLVTAIPLTRSAINGIFGTLPSRALVAFPLIPALFLCSFRLPICHPGFEILLSGHRVHVLRH